MAILNNRDKQNLEYLFGMNSGYVLDFTNRSFREFIFTSVQKDIYDEKYSYKGDSKANRLRTFWEQEEDYTVGNLIIDLLEYWKKQKELKQEKITKQEKRLYNDCKEIGNKLLGIQKKETNKHIVTEENFLNQEFKEIELYKFGFDSVTTEILNNRVNEIEKCMKAKAPLAVIFLCGSVLEGVLYLIAQKRSQEFNSSQCSPRKDNKVLPFPMWTLANFIDVASSIGLLGEDVKRFSHVLRDFRNYIHPAKQFTSQFNPDMHTATICWQVLKAAISQLIDFINCKEK